MTRRVVWLQLIIGWLPLWGLFTAIIVIMHGMPHASAMLFALRMVTTAALLGLVVDRITGRYPWPRPVGARFVALHVVFALLYAGAWFILNSAVESAIQGEMLFVLGPGVVISVLTGIWLYLMIAVISYTNQATERALGAEANAAKAQLAALRAQLNPHFLFNALHSVVQLIPNEPKRASQAAERLASLLRTTIESDRDLVSLGDELDFVERYVELERMRFGDRLVVEWNVSDEARSALVPVFAVQTLVENAVRHGAAPRIEATTVTISAAVDASRLRVEVIDDGSGGTPGQLAAATGSGLRRLRERLRVLHGDAAELDVSMPAKGGFRAILTTPNVGDDA